MGKALADEYDTDYFRHNKNLKNIMKYVVTWKRRKEFFQKHYDESGELDWSFKKESIGQPISATFHCKSFFY